MPIGVLVYSVVRLTTFAFMVNEMKVSAIIITSLKRRTDLNLNLDVTILDYSTIE
jgi:hypothetical protein